MKQNSKEKAEEEIFTGSMVIGPFCSCPLLSLLIYRPGLPLTKTRFLEDLKKNRLWLSGGGLKMVVCIVLNELGG